MRYMVVGWTYAVDRVETNNGRFWGIELPKYSDQFPHGKIAVWEGGSFENLLRMAEQLTDMQKAQELEATIDYFQVIPIPAGRLGDLLKEDAIREHACVLLERLLEFEERFPKFTSDIHSIDQAVEAVRDTYRITLISQLARQQMAHFLPFGHEVLAAMKYDGREMRIANETGLGNCNHGPFAIEVYAVRSTHAREGQLFHVEYTMTLEHTETITGSGVDQFAALF